jgi:hypothetical protein
MEGKIVGRIWGSNGVGLLSFSKTLKVDLAHWCKPASWAHGWPWVRGVLLVCNCTISSQIILIRSLGYVQHGGCVTCGLLTSSASSSPTWLSCDEILYRCCQGRVSIGAPLPAALDLCRYLCYVFEDKYIFHVLRFREWMLLGICSYEPHAIPMATSPIPLPLLASATGLAQYWASWLRPTILV